MNVKTNKHIEKMEKNNMNVDNNTDNNTKEKSVENILIIVLYMGFCALAGGFWGMAMVKVLPKDAPGWQEFVGF